MSNKLRIEVIKPTILVSIGNKGMTYIFIDEDRSSSTDEVPKEWGISKQCITNCVDWAIDHPPEERFDDENPWAEKYIHELDLEQVKEADEE